MIWARQCGRTQKGGRLYIHRAPDPAGAKAVMPAGSPSRTMLGGCCNRPAQEDLQGGLPTRTHTLAKEEKLAPTVEAGRGPTF
jgi:hypothetical protein